MLFPTVLSFYSCISFLSISIQPWTDGDMFVRLLSNVHIVVLFWLATFWLIVVYILQFNINWCIIVHAPTNIIRYERWPQAASTWQQWHKLRANVEQRSYDDKHAMGVLLVWVLLIVISWRCLFRRRLFIKFGGSYRVRRRRRWLRAPYDWHHRHR